MGAFLIWTGMILILPFVLSQPKTTVILLDNNSTSNAVVVETKAGAVIVDKPYSYTTMGSPDKQPSSAKQGDPDAIQKKYADQLNMLPAKPVSTLFYFESATAELTDESKNQINELIRIIKSREPAAVDIIGHSDSVGDADKNYFLGLERAEAVKKYLLEHNVTLKRSSVASYGKNDPLVPTQDGVSEPKNRRVEVIVR